MCAPAEVARIISSCAISMDLPVPIDCADTACSPHASSSVREARKTFSTPPKWSTSRRERVGIPDVAIGAQVPVRSILLVSKQPLEKIKTVAADTSSRTSVALLKIIFKKWWRSNAEQPEFVPMDPDLKKMLKKCDSALMI